MALLAESYKVCEVVLVAAFCKRLDVMDLQAIGRATLPTPFAIATSRCRSRLLTTR